MKIKFLLTAVLLGCATNVMPLHAQQSLRPWGDQGNGTYANPILNADFSDPDVIRVGEKYYMVASDFHFMGIQLLVSDDMVNWKYLTQIFRRLDFPGWNTNSHYAGGSWAPSIRFHNGKFWVFFCTPDEGLFMTNATDPAGPWCPLVQLSKSPKWEDPCPFWDEDGKAYLGRSKHGAGPIIVHRMSPDGTKLLDDGVTVYSGPVAEGTKFLKRDGYYYLSIPEGGVGQGWQTILRSRNIYGPYERKVVLEKGSTNINGPHQGALVDTPDGEWWFYHFQETHSLGRVVHLQPVTWTDGWPVVGVDIDRNGVGEPVAVWKKPSTRIQSAPALPAMSDAFTSSKLGLQWQFNHNPVETACRLTGHGIEFSMLRADSFKVARNTITQKMMGYNGVASVWMNLEDVADGHHSGMVCMGKQNYLLGVSCENGEKRVYLEGHGKVLLSLPFSGSSINLRLEMNAITNKQQFSYRLRESDAFTSVGEPFAMKNGFWKGVRVGLYGYNTRKVKGKVNFHDFKYTCDESHDTVSEQTPQQRIVASIARTAFPDREIAVSAAGKGVSNRAILQQAIDSCSLLGGGMVRVKAGTYNINGNIVLKSDVNLHLDEGALLKFSGRADDFLPVVLTRWEGTELYGHSPMIYAYHAENIAITGKGVIDAQGGLEFAPWSEREAADRDRLREMGDRLTPVGQRVFGEGTILRPSCIQPFGCSRILIEGVTVKNSPFWTIHPVYCDNVIVRGLTIDSHFPNNDGCDPESTSNVLIENCTFRTGDDAIAIKAGRDTDGRNIGRPSKNIVIRDCRFFSECNGLCIGSEMSGGAENIYMDRIEIGTVKNALYFKSNKDRGGFIRNVHVNDIRIECAHGAILRFETNYFGYRGGNHQASYENFTINKVQAGKAEQYAVFMDGNDDKKIRDIVISDFHVDEAKNAYYLMNTDRVEFHSSSVNGKAIPQNPEQASKKVSLDVY